jgi:hypothetical protein
MAAATVDILGTVVVPSLVIKLTRGRPAKLGTLVANNTAVAFTIPEPTRDNHGALILQVSGTAGTGPTLEISIDGGLTFLPLVLTTLTVGTALTGDTAAAAMYQVNVAGMGSGALFKFGYTGGTPTAAVWGLVG